jgi:arylsulfatase A-like enzyme
MTSSTRRQFLSMAALAAGTVYWGQKAPGLLSRRGRSYNRPQATAPNIVLVTVDALRSDHVSSYGYARNTTPNLDGLAAQGARFLQASTTSPWTYAANAAMVTGQSPTRLGASWNVAGLPGAMPTLAGLLQGAGYQTAGFASAVLIRKTYGFDRGYDHYDDSATYGYPNSAQNMAQEVNQRTLAWLDANRDPNKPLFLYIYYFDPHSWYNPPAPYDTLYDNTYTGAVTPEVIEDGQSIVGGTVTPTARDMEHILALYDGEIAYWDAKFGEMLTALQSRGLLDNTLLTVTADHGESFGEHEKWAHAGSLYEEAMRVPLLMRYTGVIGADTSRSVPVSNMDLMPTLLDYAGVTPPEGLSAVSLRPLIEGSQPAQRDVFCEVDGMNDPAHWIYWNAARTDLRAVYRDEWKYIHHVGRPEEDELYQLNGASVYETTNLLTSEPAMAQALRQAVMHNFSLWKIVLPYVSG